MSNEPQDPLLMDHEGTVTVMRDAKNAPTSGATDRIT